MDPMDLSISIAIFLYREISKLDAVSRYLQVRLSSLRGRVTRFIFRETLTGCVKQEKIGGRHGFSPRTNLLAEAEPWPAAGPVGGWDGPNFAENDVFFDFVGYDREKSIFSFF